jgi:hypothetical protein
VTLAARNGPLCPVTPGAWMSGRASGGTGRPAAWPGPAGPYSATRSGPAVAALVRW